MVDEIGCSGKVLFPRPKTSYWIDGKIYRSEMNASTLKLPLSLISLFRLEFADARDMHADVAGRPVWLGLMHNADQVRPLVRLHLQQVER